MRPRARSPRRRRRRRTRCGVIAAIERAQRPVIVAGRGAVLAGAREALEELSERVGAPLATSAMGHGIFDGHPFSLGISGGFASPLAQRGPSASPTSILAFGARSHALDDAPRRARRRCERSSSRSTSTSRGSATRAT